MSVFDGGTRRIRARTADGEEREHYEDSDSDVQQLVANYRAGGAKAVLVEYLHFIVGDTDTRLSFGDYWGDEEEDEEDDG